MTTRISNLSRATSIAKTFGIKRGLTFWRAAIREPEALRQWQQFLDAHSPVAAHDLMMLRSLLPYMRQHFTAEQRRDLLRAHRLTMQKTFMADEGFIAEPGLVVATLAGKNDDAYTLTIGGNTSKEGEMAFGIYDTSGHYMAKMEATIGPDEQGKPVLWIGGLQGAKPPLGRDEVVKATRDLFGLRPKGAVMLAAQTFAQMLGLTALRAPGNEGHISQRGFRKLRAKRKIYADYGQFWEEIGGVRYTMASDEYILPVTPQVREVSEVKPNKRSEWKKRQTISEDLAAQVRAVLASVKRS
jgi:uncharacterized protein